MNKIWLTSPGKIMDSLEITELGVKFAEVITNKSPRSQDILPTTSTAKKYYAAFVANDWLRLKNVFGHMMRMYIN